MTQRHFSTEEVVALLDPEEVDDPQEVFMEGSDEEFDDLEDLENGNTFSNVNFS